MNWTWFVTAIIWKVTVNQSFKSPEVTPGKVLKNYFIRKLIARQKRLCLSSRRFRTFHYSVVILRWLEYFESFFPRHGPVTVGINRLVGLIDFFGRLLTIFVATTYPRVPCLTHFIECLVINEAHVHRACTLSMRLEAEEGRGKGTRWMILQPSGSFGNWLSVARKFISFASLYFCCIVSYIFSGDN